MGFFDKLQFWKKSDPFSEADGSGSGLDESFTGTDEKSGFAPGTDNQGVTGQNGDLPPLDQSSASQQNQFQDSGFMQEQNPAGQDGMPDPTAGAQNQDFPQGMSPSSGQTQQQAGEEEVSMQTEHGEKRIGKNLAQEYIKNHEQSDNNQPSQQPLPQQSGGRQSVEHSLELLNVKLDSLKNAMDAMSQRLLKIENDLEEERKKRW